MTLEPILLLRLGRAGDAIKALPALRALRARLPNADLHLLASEHNHAVFELEPGFKVHRLFAHWKRFRPESLKASLLQAGMPAYFSKIVNLSYEPREDGDGLMTTLSAGERFSAVLGAPSDQPLLRLALPEGSPDGRDETQNIALLLSQAFGVDLLPYIDDYSAAPCLGERDRQEALDKMGEKRGPWLGFHPFAANPQRSIPMKRWEKFLGKATTDETVSKFFLFGMPRDYRRLETLRSLAARPDDVEFCFPTSFRALGAYLERLDGLVAIDSGPLHLAQSIGVKSLGILTGSDTARWFANLNEGDMLLRRGLFLRVPTSMEMVWAFQRWMPAAFPVSP